MQILHNPLYAGAYAFGRIAQKTRIVDGRARKVSRFRKPREEWNVLLRDNHAGYISWQEYEALRAVPLALTSEQISASISGASAGVRLQSRGRGSGR